MQKNEANKWRTKIGINCYINKIGLVIILQASLHFIYVHYGYTQIFKRKGKNMYTLHNIAFFIRKISLLDLKAFDVQHLNKNLGKLF